MLLLNFAVLYRTQHLQTSLKFQYFLEAFHDICLSIANKNIYGFELGLSFINHSLSNVSIALYNRIIAASNRKFGCIKKKRIKCGSLD